MRFSICGRQTIGGRDYQEDSWLVAAPSGQVTLNDNQTQSIVADGHALVIVSDGIGSGGHGDEASKHIVTRFRDHLAESGKIADENLHDAITATDAELNQIKKQKGYGRSMGGTVVAVVFYDHALKFLSIGDSHLFRFRDDEIHYMNQKHSFGSELGELAGLGQQSWPDALHHPDAGKITSAVIGSGIGTYQIARRDVRPGDIYVLASDGIETIDGELLRRLVSAYRDGSQPQALDAIIGAIDAHGKVFQQNSHDNATLVMVRCDEETATERDTGAVPIQADRTEDVQTAVRKPDPAETHWSPRLIALALVLTIILFVSVAVSAYLFLREPSPQTALQDPIGDQIDAAEELTAAPAADAQPSLAGAGQTNADNVRDVSTEAQDPTRISQVPVKVRQIPINRANDFHP